MSETKPCYGKCDRCVWKYNGGCSEWDKNFVGERKVNQWCENMVSTKENPDGTDCIAHLAEGRVFKCPYKSQQDRERAEYPCEDYEPRKGDPDA